MACWPRDDRTKATPSSKESKHLQDWPRDHPSLQGGMIGAATLIEGDGRFTWAFANKSSGVNRSQVDESGLRAGIHQNIFPPTRAPDVRPSRTTVKQRAEQGANFLRTFFPDVDIAAELIRDELIEDTALSNEAKEFDPFIGNLLGVFYAQSFAHSSTSLIFPMGETGRELNISTFYHTNSSRITFKPSAIPMHTFRTPIQQILVSTDLPAYGQDVGLAIRTFGNIQFFRMRRRDDFSISLTELNALSRASISDEKIVDMKYLPSYCEALAIGEKGGIFRCNFLNGMKTTALFKNANGEPKEGNGAFWRLAVRNNPVEYFSMSSNQVLHFDARAKTPQDFFYYGQRRDILTSIHVTEQDDLLRLCSTDRLVWMDPRFAGRPLLSHSHGRQYDRYLEAHTYPTDSHSLTLLTTRRNALMTVYDVSHSNDLTFLRDSPYSLTIGPDLSGIRAGRAALTQPCGSVSLSEEGALSFTQLSLGNSGQNAQFTVEQSEGFEALKLAASKLHPDPGPLGRQDMSEVNFRSTYHALFRDHFQDIEQCEEQHKDAVYELIDCLPNFWKQKDAPIEHVLTTYDIAFRSGDEPSQPSRADFLTGSLLNSKRGYHALKQGVLSASRIQAPWKGSIGSTLGLLDEEFETDPEKLMVYLQRFNLSGYGQPASKKYEDFACKQLALDLLLSADIFSEQAPARPQEGGQALEVMAEALSLGGEPPTVEFNYFSPMEHKKSRNTNGEIRNTIHPPELPMGVRSLLKEWDSGDPEDYVYQDPYGEVVELMGKEIKSSPFNSEAMAQIQQPPQIIVTKAVPPIPSKVPRKFAESQDISSTRENGMFGIFPLPREQQDMVISTQILPGPFGGRPAKKPAKKRLGGF